MPKIKKSKKTGIVAEAFYGVWKCADCEKTVEWTYLDCVEGGSPICTDCDTEMDFTGETGVKEKK